MGLILKIVIFAVAAYGIWTTANRWFNILGGNRKPAAPPPPPQPANRPQGPRENPNPRPRVIEDTHPCPGCGTYIAVGQAKCGRPECPQT